MMLSYGAIKNRSKNDLILFCFLLSGLFSLIYEIVWMRKFVLIFGNTIRSSAITVAAFMIGLGLGGYWGGIWAKKNSTRRLLIGYGILESIIGVFAFLSPFLFVLAEKLMHIFSQDDITLKIITAMTILLVPTICMGGTLPILAEYWQRHHKESVENFSSLYAINTMGAILGVFFAGFILIEIFGLNSTLRIIATLNILLAITVFFLANEESKNKNGALTTNAAIDRDNHNNQSRQLERIVDSRYRFWALTLAIGSGFVSLLLQIIWFRLSILYLGPYTYSISFILMIFLAGIYCGSTLVKKNSRLVIANTNIIIAYLILILGGLLGAQFWLLTKGSVISILTFAPLLFLQTTVMGAILPCAVSLFSTGHQNESRGFGSQVGIVYLVNSLAAALGTLMAGFVIFKIIWPSKLIYLMSAIISTLGLILYIFINYRSKKFYARVAYYSVFLLIIFILLAQSNKFNHPLYHQFIVSRPWLEYFYNEDEEAAILSYNDRGRKNLLINNISVTALIPDTKLFAHIPMLYGAGYKRILNIGLGMGTTHTSFLEYPQTDVTTIELVPSSTMIESLQFFQSNTAEKFANPRSHLIINDGRNFLKYSKEYYDIISIDPAPPVRSSGNSSLYSKEFLQDVKSHLLPHGIFAIWVFKQDDRSFQEIIQTALSEFPYVDAWKALDTPGILLIAAEHPIALDKMADQIIQNTILPDINKELKAPLSTADILKLKLFNRERLLSFIENDTLTITDDKPILEFFLLNNMFLR